MKILNWMLPSINERQESLERAQDLLKIAVHTNLYQHQ